MWAFQIGAMGVGVEARINIMCTFVCVYMCAYVCVCWEGVAGNQAKMQSLIEENC